MKAIVCRDWGDPCVLRLEDIDTPRVSNGHVLVLVRAADVAFQHVLMVAGKYQTRPDLPFVPGDVIAGEISVCGEDVDGYQIGDRVLALVPAGGYAEQAVASQHGMAKIPEPVSDAEAVVIGMTYATAHTGLIGRARLRSGDVLLVRGAAGGVGRAAVELGRVLGATVIAATSTAAKAAIAAEAGAHHVIDTTNEDVRARVLDLTGGHGADVIFDTVGADFKQSCLRTIARDGRILIVGFAGGEVPEIPASYILNKNCTVMGVNWGNSVWRNDPVRFRQVLAELMTLCAQRRIRPLISEMIKPTEIASALSALSGRASVGRTVLSFG
jgi:NADPH2:quinone reductase